MPAPACAHATGVCLTVSPMSHTLNCSGVIPLASHALRRNLGGSVISSQVSTHVPAPPKHSSQHSTAPSKTGRRGLTPVHADGLAAVDVLVDLDRVVRAAVHGTHGPAREVGPDRDHRKVERAELGAAAGGGRSGSVRAPAVCSFTTHISLNAGQVGRVDSSVQSRGTAR